MLIKALGFGHAARSGRELNTLTHSAALTVYLPHFQGHHIETRRRTLGPHRLAVIGTKYRLPVVGVGQWIVGLPDSQGTVGRD